MTVKLTEEVARAVGGQCGLQLNQKVLRKIETWAISETAGTS